MSTSSTIRPPAATAGPSSSVKMAIYNYNGAIDGPVVIPSSPTGFRNLGALAGITLDSVRSTLALSLATTGVFKFPALTDQTRVDFRLRLNGTIAGGSGAVREFFFQTRRIDGVTSVGSGSSVKVDTNNIGNRDIVLLSDTRDRAVDLFTLDGVLLGIVNNSGQEITITSFSLTIYQIL